VTQDAADFVQRYSGINGLARDVLITILELDHSMLLPEEMRCESRGKNPSCDYTGFPPEVRKRLASGRLR